MVDRHPAGLDQIEATTVCRQNISAFLARDIAQWNGLATGCRRDDLIRWLSFNEGEGRAIFGAERVEYEFLTLTHERFRGNLEFYFRSAELNFIVTEYWSFDKDECKALLQQLGDPAHRLDFYWRDGKLERAEWSYLDRGVTLGVIPATQLIAKVTVYPPCTLKDYKGKFYDTHVVTEFRNPP